MEIGKQNLVQNPFSVFKEYENEIWRLFMFSQSG
jgi:hypothetical protein